MKRLFLFFLLLTACGGELQSQPTGCPSGVTTNGQCCAHVCELDCPQGYKPNTCHCECASPLGLEAFDSNPDVAPPGLP